MLGVSGSSAYGQNFGVVGPVTSYGGTYARSVDCSNTGPGGTSHVINYGDINPGTFARGEATFQGNTFVLGWNVSQNPGNGHITKIPAAVDGATNWECGTGDTFVTLSFPPFNTVVGPRAYRELVSGGGYFQVLMLPGMDFSDAVGISDDGSIGVGRQWSSIAPMFDRAYRFNFSTFVLQDLGTLPAQSNAAALDVSGDGGTVVGRSGPFAFSWRPSEGMLSLGSLPGQVSAYASCVGGNGLTIAGVSNNGSVDRGFRWSPIVGMQQLPMLAGGAQLRPKAMDANGWIIGGQSLDGSGNVTCFIWTTTLGTQTLVSHLVGRGLFGQLQGVVFTDVTGISADGRNICGLGTSNGVQVGWLASNLQCASMGGGPTTAYYCNGGNAFVVANGSGGPASGLSSFQWYRNSQLIVAGPQPSGSFIPSTDVFQLVIQGATASDAGNYFCVVSSAGACAIQGPTTTLVMQASPTITLQPVPTQACVGNTVTLTTQGVPASGTPVYRWQRRVPPFPNVYADIVDGPTGNGSTYTGTGTGAMSIVNAQAADSERYRCLVWDSLCGPGNAASTDRVLVTVSPETSVVGPGDVSVCLGDNNVTLNVSVAPANATLQWQRRDPPFSLNYVDIYDGPTGNGGWYSGTQSASLTIMGAFAGDMTGYRCVAVGPCTAVLGPEGELTGLSPPNITMHPQAQQVCICGTAVLGVGLFGPNPGPLTYQWKKGANWSVADGPTGSGSVISGAQTATLTISGFKPSDVDQYWCEVNGQCASVVSNTAWLSTCVGDYDDGSDTGQCDGSLGIEDLFYFLNLLNDGDLCADLDDGSSTGTPDLSVGVDDLLYFLQLLDLGC